MPNAREVAGNQGDVFKHAILTAVLDALLATWPNGAFRYVETHAGCGGGLLPQKGQWTEGVGRIPWKDPPPALRAYLSNCIRGKPGGPAVAGDLYVGSAGLAIRLLEQVPGGYEAFLHEIDAGTQEYLRGYVHAHVADESRVSISGMSGYTALRGIYSPEKVSLLFMDPFDRDERNVREALKTKVRNVLVWGPRFNAPAPKRDEPLPEEESAQGKEWTEELGMSMTIEQARWAQWGPGHGGVQAARGCFMAGRFERQDIADAMRNAADAVRAVMNWQA